MPGGKNRVFSSQNMGYVDHFQYFCNGLHHIFSFMNIRRHIIGGFQARIWGMSTFQYFVMGCVIFFLL